MFLRVFILILNIISFGKFLVLFFVLIVFMGYEGVSEILYIFKGDLWRGLIFFYVSLDVSWG